MTPATSQSFDALRVRLDEAVTAGDTSIVAQHVKAALQQVLRDDGLVLDAEFCAPRTDSYARRLLHRDPDGRYTVVVMTWGPGQQTSLHDHAGIWCVECVVQGRMLVTQYDLVDEHDGNYRFREQTAVNAERGSAGCLIPPFEYHTLSNALPDGSSITLHVYGGEMSHCHVFEPAADGAYRKLTRSLSYHNVE
jgi:predicted metal-dependent enzyme (double-stranded beta helix superfamily)